MAAPWEKDILIDAEPTKKQSKVLPWEQDSLAEPETGGKAIDYVVGSAGGFNRGLAEITGLPVDLANAALKKVGLGSDKPFLGSESIKNIIQFLPGEQFPAAPQDPLGRTLERTGAEIGATAIPAMGVLRAARGIAPAHEVGRGFIQTQILDPVRRTPGVATIGEVTGATGSGLAAGAAREKFPDNPVAENLAQVVGGFGVNLLAYTPAALGAKLYAKLGRKFSPKAQKAAAERLVSDLLNESMTDEIKGNIQQGQRLSKKMPGFEPSVAESSGSGSLILQQKNIGKHATGKDFEKLLLRRKNNYSALEDFSFRKAPAGDDNIEYVFDAANNRIELYGDTVSRLAGRVAQKQKKIADNLPTIDRIKSGANIREYITDARSERSIIMSARASELGLLDADLTKAYGPWKQAILKKYKPKYDIEDIGENYPQVLRDMAKSDAGTTKNVEIGLIDPRTNLPITRPEVEPVDFGYVKALRERVSDDLIDAMSSANPSRRKVRVLALLKKDIDTFLDEAGGKLGEAYATFRKEYFDNYITPFESGAIFKAKSKDGTGFYRTNDEQVADFFLNNESAARQYRSIFANNQKAMKALEVATLDKMKDDIVVNGVIDEGRLAKWQKKNQRVLNELPEINQKIQNVEQLTNDIARRNLQLNKRLQQTQDMKLTKKLTSFIRGDISADTLLEDALTNPNRMGQLMMVIKTDKDAVASLRRILWSRATANQAENTYGFLVKHEKSLRKVFTDRHLNDLQDIALGRTMIDRVPAPKGEAYQPRPLAKLEEFIGQGLPQLASRAFAWKAGRVQKGFLATESALRGIRGRALSHAESIFNEALFDPQVARDMAELINAKEVSLKTANRLYSRFFAMGLPYADDESQ